MPTFNFESDIHVESKNYTKRTQITVTQNLHSHDHYHLISFFAAVIYQQITVIFKRKTCNCFQLLIKTGAYEKQKVNKTYRTLTWQ